jgi:LysR family transcriptional regulator, transcription activator of glutamate synthase operon
MNIDQMKYIIKVTKEGSITKAAEKLHLSPAAISQSISQLENELGFSIFTRSKKGMSPTSEGKVIISKSYEILNKIQELHDELASQKKFYTNVLKVACTPSMTYIVYDAFLSFMETNKDSKVIIEELDQDSILMKMKNDDIDLAYATYTKDELNRVGYKFGIGYDHIYTGYVCVCINNQSKLASFPFITPEDLRKEKVVMYNSNFVKDFNKMNLLNKDIFITSNNIEILRTAVLSGHSFTLLYNFIFKNHSDVKDGSLVMIPFNNPDTIYHDVWSIYPLSKGLSGLAKEFEKQVIKLLLE